MYHEFKDYGAPAQVTGLFAKAAGVDRKGHPVLFQARGQAPDPFILLMTRIDTGETRQFTAESSESNYPWGICVSQTGQVYIGSCCDGAIYQFDIQTEELHRIGIPSPTETYIWSLAEGPDGIIYGSTYGNCRLVGYNPQTQKLLDLARLDPTEQYARSIVASADGFVYSGIGTSKACICAYQISTGRIIPLIPDDERAPGMGQVTRDSEGKCYGISPTRNGNKYYRLEGPCAIEISENDIPPCGRIEFQDHSELVSIDEDSQTLRIRNTILGYEKAIPFTQQASGTRIFSLAAGPDQRVYMSSFLPLYICSLDPKTGETTLHGRIDGGEIYSFVNHNNKLWTAAYPGGIIASYDPDKPWDPSGDPSGNPYVLPGDNTYIHRPYHMVVSPDSQNILIGGIPDYGMLGGSLVVFDPSTYKKEAEYRNIIPEHSIKGLCLTADGLVCGGSSTEGGGGAHTTDDDAQIFLWDYFDRRTVFSAVAVPGTQSISDLILGPDRMIYGLADDFVFVFDPTNREIVHVQRSAYGDPAFNALTISPKKGVLALLGSDIVEIQPETYQTQSIAHYEGQITAGVAVIGQTLYFGDNSHVIGLTLS